MKKILSIALILAAFSLGVQAQEKQHPARSKGKAKKEWNKKSTDALDLTADQEKQMKVINMDFKNQVKAIRADKSLSEDQKKQQMKNLHAARTAKVKALLTDEQQQKITQQKRHHRKQSKKTTSTK